MKQQGKPNPATITKAGSGAMAHDGETDNGMDLAHRTSLTAQTLRTRVVVAQRVPVPRDLDQVLANVKREASLTGTDFEYRWTVTNRDGSKSVIEGVSIDGAMILLRNFGNCTTDIEQEEETATHWLFRATFIDWETGFVLPRLFRQRKSQALGRMDEDRTMDIALQIGQSKAQRNATVKAMPVWLVREAIDAARAGAEAKIKDIPAERERAIANYGRAGITLPMLEEKVGALSSPPGPPVASAMWVARDLVNLRSLWNALRERETSKEAEWPSLAATPPAAEATPAPATPNPATPEAAPAKEPDPYDAPIPEGAAPAAPAQAAPPKAPASEPKKGGAK